MQIRYPVTKQINQVKHADVAIVVVFAEKALLMQGWLTLRITSNQSRQIVLLSLEFFNFDSTMSHLLGR